MTDITIPPLIYLREAGRTVELCIKPQDSCLQTYALTIPQLAHLATKAPELLAQRFLDVKV